MKNKSEYPEQYLHISDPSNGESWIVPIRGNGTLNLKTQVKRWIKSHFGSGSELDGDLMPGLDGQFYARIMTDGRSPDSVVCWSSGGFYVK